MTSTRNREKTLTEQEEWTALFPMEATKNYLSSVSFLKKLTAIALSTITYVRDMFPESCFKTQNFAGTQLRILKETTSCELSTFVSTALLASYDAFEKKYLKQLAMCVYEDETRPETLLECYVFTYRYNDQDVSVSFHREDKAGALSTAQTFPCTTESIQKATRQILRCCLVALQSVDALPRQYDLSLRLYYYDDITPQDYQPEGFVGDSREDHVPSMLGNGLKIGKVLTPYHKMNMSISHANFLESDGVAVSVADGRDADEQIVNVGEIERQNTTSSAVTVLINGNTSGTPAADIGSPVPYGFIVGQPIVRCVCNMTNESNDLIDLEFIDCRECATSQHSVCFGLLPNDAEAVQSHVCLDCALVNPALVCSDPHFISMTQVQRESRAKYRRVLWWCDQLQYVNLQTVVDNLPVPAEVALKIMERLEKHGVVQPLRRGQENGLLTRRTINSRKLKREVLPRFFKTSSPSSLPTSQNDKEKNETYLLSPEEQLYDIERRIQENINLDENHNNTRSGLERNMQISSNPQNNYDLEPADMEVEPEQAINKKYTKRLDEKEAEKVKPNTSTVNKVNKTKRKIETVQKAEPRPKRKCSAKTKRSV